MLMNMSDQRGGLGGNILFSIFYDKFKVASYGSDGKVSFYPEEITRSNMPGYWVPHIKELLENSLPEGFRRDSLMRLALRSGAKPSFTLELVPYIAELPGRFSIGNSSLNDGQKSDFRTFYQLPVSIPQGLRIESLLPISFFDPQSELRVSQKPSFSGYQDKFTANLKLDFADESNGVLKLSLVDQETERGNVIVKPSHPKYPFIWENEYLCMELARSSGLQAPRVFLFKQPDIKWEPQHIIVERFDLSVVNGERTVLDVSEFAPLMGLAPEKKYDATTEQLFEHAKSILSPGDVEILAKVYLFGCIVRNGDMHTKNFSTIFVEGKNYLTPVYDMINTAVYGDYTVLALPLGGSSSPKSEECVKFFLDYLSPEDIQEMAAAVKGSLSGCAERAFAQTSQKDSQKFRKTLEQSISGSASQILSAIKKMKASWQ